MSIKKEYTKVTCSILLADRSTWVTMNMHVEAGKALPEGPFAVKIGEVSNNTHPTTGVITQQMTLSGEVLFAHPLLEYYQKYSFHMVEFEGAAFHLCKVGDPTNWSGATAALLA